MATQGDGFASEADKPFRFGREEQARVGAREAHPGPRRLVQDE